MAASGSGGTPALAGRPFLFLLPYPSLSGLELFGLRFARDLLDRGLPAAIASPPGGLIAEQAARRQIPWVALPELWRWDPWAVARLAGFLREGKPRVVVAFRTQAIYRGEASLLTTKAPLGGTRGAFPGQRGGRKSRACGREITRISAGYRPTTGRRRLS